MIEPSKIAAAAKRKENENVKFRTFLKINANSDELDKQFFDLHNELFDGYDCREYSTLLQGGEAIEIAAFLGLTKQDFIGAVVDRMAQNTTFCEKVLDDEKFGGMVKDLLVDYVYEGLRA